MIRIYALIIIGAFSCNFLVGQTTQQLNINVNPLLNNYPLILEKESTKGITITSFKFYLTQFSLIKDSKTVWKEKESYHLIDASNSSSLQLKFEIPENVSYDEIHFLLGTDSLTNVAGVMGGDLDPTKGMYWAWNSGYVNFKLEGKNNKTPFGFHLGGYIPSTVQNIKLASNKNDIIINYDIAAFLNQIDLKKQHKLMSPGKEAQRLSKIAASLFLMNE